MSNIFRLRHDLRGTVAVVEVDADQARFIADVVRAACPTNDAAQEWERIATAVESGKYDGEDW